MGWNEIVSALVAVPAGTWTWLGSTDGMVASQWLVALGTTGAVAFAVWSTASERKHRNVLQEVELTRAFDAALEKRSQLADQISFSISENEIQSSLWHRLVRRQKRFRYAVIHNPSPTPIHKVALIHMPPHRRSAREEYLAAIYSCSPFWSLLVLPAGQSVSIKLRRDLLDDHAEVYLRFETVNATSWAKSENGYALLLSDSSLLGVTAEKVIGNMLARHMGPRRRKRDSRAATVSVGSSAKPRRSARGTPAE